MKSTLTYDEKQRIYKKARIMVTQGLSEFLCNALAEAYVAEKNPDMSVIEIHDIHSVLCVSDRYHKAVLSPHIKEFIKRNMASYEHVGYAITRRLILEWELSDVHEAIQTKLKELNVTTFSDEISAAAAAQLRADILDKFIN